MPVDPITPWQSILLVLWVFWVGIDRRALGNFQIHQPLIAGAVSGFIIGRPEMGLLLGAALQALWLHPLTLGGVIPLASGPAACAGALWIRLVLPAGSGYLGAGLSTGSLSIGMLKAVVPLPLIILIAAWLGKILEGSIRHLNRRIETREIARLDSGNRSMSGPTILGISLAGLAALLSVAGTVGPFYLARLLMEGNNRIVTELSDVPSRGWGFLPIYLWILLGIGIGGEVGRLIRVHGKGWAKGWGWITAGLLGGLILGWVLR